LVEAMTREIVRRAPAFDKATGPRLMLRSRCLPEGAQMYDAMFKKNPLMSLWLSAANSAAGSARGLWLAEMQRQQSAMMQEFTRQMIDFWSGAWCARMVSTGREAAAPEPRKAKRRG